MAGDSPALRKTWGISIQIAKRKKRKHRQSVLAAATNIFLRLIKKDPHLVAEYVRIHGDLPGERRQVLIGKVLPQKDRYKVQKVSENLESFLEVLHERQERVIAQEADDGRSVSATVV